MFYFKEQLHLFCLQNYYTFDPQYATEEQARASIIEHMRDNMRKILSEEKARVGKNFVSTRTVISLKRDLPLLKPPEDMSGPLTPLALIHLTVVVGYELII